MGNLITVAWNGGTVTINAFADIPRVIQDAELPCMVILPGAATYDKADTGDTNFVEDRTYQLFVLIQNGLLGTESQAQISLDPFFDTVRDYFMARPGLELDSAQPTDDNLVYDAQIVRDAGFELIPYPGGANTKQYIGIVFDLQVKEWHGISYQD